MELKINPFFIGPQPIVPSMERVEAAWGQELSRQLVSYPLGILACVGMELASKYGHPLENSTDTPGEEPRQL